MNFKDPDLYNANLSAVYDKFGREPMTITVPEAARWLGLDPRTLRSMRGFPIKRIGTRSVVVKTALASWMTREA